MICSKLALCVQLAQLEHWPFDFDDFAEARVWRHQLGGGSDVTSVLEHAHKSTGRVLLFDGALVVSSLGTTMLQSRDFSSDVITPLEVLNETVNEGADVPRGLR